MQNKGIVKLFALLFGLVSIYQLSFTFKANQIEDEAEAYAASKFDNPDLKNAEELRYLDSLSNKDVFNIGIAKFTYNEVKEKAMNLGLDLKGGINVILEISVKDILKGLSNHSKNPVFNKALEDAEEIQKNAQEPYLESFFKAFDAIKGDTRLASPDIFANRTLVDDIDISMSDDEVKSVLKKKVDESIVSAFEVLRKRIDKFGVTSPNIQRLGSSGRILVELPGAKDVDRVKKLLQSTAQLEFWDVVNAQTLGDFFAKANETLKGIVKEETAQTEATTKDSTEVQESEIDKLLGETKANDSIQPPSSQGPLYDMMQGPSYPSALFAVKVEDKNKLAKYLNMPQVRADLPLEQRYTKFAFGIPELNKQTKEEIVNVYALKGNRDNEPELSGAVITDARQSYNNQGKPSVSMQMNAKGAKIWEEMTGRAYAQQSQIAIVLDNIVYSAPGVTNGAISGGNSEI
ncbi:MAG TPA: hypothetical protein VJ945_05405, partial [Flavobacteriaceae bacterium]|nr:hypothetical protein [Flavobacteriaceae bacterium]